MKKTQQLMNIYEVDKVEELNYSQLAEENKPNQLWKVEYTGKNNNNITEVCVFTEEGDIMGKAKGFPYAKEGEYFTISFMNKEKTSWVVSSNSGPADAPYIAMLEKV